MEGEKAPAVEVCKGVNGLDKVVLREARDCSAEVYLYGGHITSWKNDGEELLFVSNKAIFKPPKAIRGGIPICFPQFSNHGSLEQHGFARNKQWSIDTDPPPFPTVTSSRAFVDLILKPSEEDLKIWPNSYEFRLRVTLGPGGDLMLTSRIRNTNTEGKTFSFTFAYHTYFFVSDIRFAIRMMPLLLVNLDTRRNTSKPIAITSTAQALPQLDPPPSLLPDAAPPITSRTHSMLIRSMAKDLTEPTTFLASKSFIIPTEPIPFAEARSGVERIDISLYNIGSRGGSVAPKFDTSRRLRMTNDYTLSAHDF